MSAKHPFHDSSTPSAAPDHTGLRDGTTPVLGAIGRLKRSQHVGGVVLCLLVVILTRLPIMLNHGAYLDGDECVVGLMARHVLAGQDLPVMFYGASFGVAFFEVMPMAAAGWVFGLTPAVMQASMLALFALALIPLWLALRRIAGLRAAWLAVLLVAACPAWMRVSLASWGYNVSAFLFANLALWFSTRLAAEPATHSYVELLAAGGCSALAFLTQPIYWLGLLPWVAVMLWHRRRWSDVGILCAAGLAVVGLMLVARGLGPRYWNPPLLRDPHVLGSLLRLPQHLWATMSGAYFLEDLLPLNFWAAVSTTLWTIAAVTAVLQIPVDWARGRHSAIGTLVLLSAAIIGSFTLFIRPGIYGHRHLLPAVSYLVVLMALAFDRLVSASQRRWRIAGALMLLFLMAAGSTTALKFGKLNFSGSSHPGALDERGALQTLIAELETRGIHHVYCTGSMFQWKLIFASDERILARWTQPEDRYPAYPKAVDQALWQGKPVAIVDEGGDPESLLQALADFPLARPETIAGRYMVIMRPPRELIARWFELNPPR